MGGVVEHCKALRKEEQEEAKVDPIMIQGVRRIAQQGSFQSLTDPFLRLSTCRKCLVPDRATGDLSRNARMPQVDLRHLSEAFQAVRFIRIRTKSPQE